VHLVRDPLPDARDRPRLRVIGVGNAWRRDDGVGLEVARRLQGLAPGCDVLEREGEPAALIDAMEGADAVWLVDAVHSGAEAGTIHRLDVAGAPLPAELFRASTHALGLAEAVELARALGRLPRHAVVYGIEGNAFEAGEGLSAEVEAAADRVVSSLREEVERFTSKR
jgi:hydrogenase maturation protease